MKRDTAIGLSLAHAGAILFASKALFNGGVDYVTLESIDVSLERALLFTYPALIVAWLALTRRVRPGRKTIAALGLTYAGIVLVVGAFEPQLWRQNLAGSMLVLFCAMTTASCFLPGERPGAWQLPGTALILAGIAVVARRR